MKENLLLKAQLSFRRLIVENAKIFRSHVKHFRHVKEITESRLVYVNNLLFRTLMRGKQVLAYALPAAKIRN